MEVKPPRGTEQEQTYWLSKYETAIAKGVPDAIARAEADMALARKQEFIAREKEPV